MLRETGHFKRERLIGPTALNPGVRSSQFGAGALLFPAFDFLGDKNGAKRLIFFVSGINHSTISTILKHDN